MNVQELKAALHAGAYDKTFQRLYPGCWEGQRKRYLHIAEEFGERFGGDRPIELYSAPGRSEIGGNHTDHQQGRVLAAAVTLDAVAICAKNDRNVIRIYSEGHGEERINLEKLEIVPAENGTTAALIRGIVARLYELDLRFGGFDAYVSSDVLPGSGLSSSAAYEVLVGNILNHFCCGGALDPIQIAKIGQYAENVYFGKPCGLMDQMGSSVGGAVAIDFADPSAPLVKKVKYDFTRSGHALCIVDTGSSHGDLTDDYADITREMGAVAAHFNKRFLRDVPEADFRAAIPSLRVRCGDRAVLRAIHYYEDDRRAVQEGEALERGDFARFLELVNASGLSSAVHLQNTWSISDPSQQAIPLALAAGQELLEGTGAIRVHGGGFAGTIQAFVPNDRLEAFRSGMEALLGRGKCHILHIRPQGGTVVIG